MRLLRIPSLLLVLAPTLAVAVVASCSTKEREPYPGSGGAGGGTSTTMSGITTTDAVTTTGTETTTTSGIPTTSSGPCADTQADPLNCGACGHDCNTLLNVASSTCEAGVCTLTCANGFLDCTVGAEDGCEADPVNDPKNCNGCGVSCALAQTCSASACADNFTDCATVGTCADAACNEPMRYSVDVDFVVDLPASRTLWQRYTKGPLDYTMASDYCASLTLAGVTGWRLPTGPELGGIVFNAGGLQGCGGTYCNPAIDQSVFSDTVSDEYWTSDVYMPGLHYCVSFCDGRKTPYKEDDASAHYLRCVHDPVP